MNMADRIQYLRKSKGILHAFVFMPVFLAVSIASYILLKKSKK